MPTHVGRCQQHDIFTGSDESCPAHPQMSDSKCRAESWRWRETRLHRLLLPLLNSWVNLDWEMTFSQFSFTWLVIRYEVWYAGQWQECLSGAQTISYYKSKFRLVIHFNFLPDCQERAGWLYQDLQVDVICRRRRGHMKYSWLHWERINNKKTNEQTRQMLICFHN